jgi:outer membrane protein assembly factor BamA
MGEITPVICQVQQNCFCLQACAMARAMQRAVMVKNLLFFLCLVTSATALGQLGEVKLVPDSTNASTDTTRIVKVNKVFIQGNRRTRDQIITREISLKPGTSHRLPHLLDSLEYDRFRIYNTNLFNKVDIFVFELGADSVNFFIQVDERWYIYPAPVFRLADRNFNDWWVNQNGDLNRVNYGMNFTHYNFRGRSERLRLYVQSGFEQRLLFNWRIPYVDKKQQIGIMPEFQLVENKNLAYETTDHLRHFLTAEETGDELLRRIFFSSVTTTLRKRYYDFHYFTVGGTSASISDTIAYLNPNYFGGSRTSHRYLSVGYGYQYDRRNNMNYPTKGFNIFVNAAKFGLTSSEDVDFWRFYGVGARYWDLGNKFYIASSFSAMHTLNSLPYFNYWGLGFDRIIYVRGYELELIEGQSFLMSKNSARKLLFSTTKNIKKIMPVKQFQTFPIALYGKVFFDSGWVAGYRGYENNDRLSNKLIYGIGTGVDIHTIYDLVLRLEYSYNAEGQANFFLNFRADL